MDISIPYGNTQLHATLPWARVLDTLRLPLTARLDDPIIALLEGLRRPVGTSALSHYLGPDRTVLIIVSDSFRKTGIHVLLPELIRYIGDHGIPDSGISFLFATGTHRGPTADEASEILGASIYTRFRERVFTHNACDEALLVDYGLTSRGTPVYINRRAHEADVVIATGTVVPHYFGGFGGGRKSIVPGIAGVKTIAANHALNLDPTENRLDPDVSIGRLDGNPVAEDMLEGARRCPVDFLINTVLDREGNIARIYCGELEAAHREACRFAETFYTVPFSEKADFVVASAGNAKNFVQSHKSLYNAYQVVRPGGSIILATPAPEGFGGNRFEAWLRLGSAERIIQALRKNAEINGQTALSTVEKAQHAVLITEMAAHDVELLGARKAASLQDALDIVQRKHAVAGSKRPTCYVMPDAPFSVPILTSQGP